MKRGESFLGGIKEMPQERKISLLLAPLYKIMRTCFSKTPHQNPEGEKISLRGR